MSEGFGSGEWGVRGRGEKEAGSKGRQAVANSLDYKLTTSKQITASIQNPVLC